MTEGEADTGTVCVFVDMWKRSEIRREKGNGFEKGECTLGSHTDTSRQVLEQCGVGVR